MWFQSFKFYEELDESWICPNCNNYYDGNLCICWYWYEWEILEKNFELYSEQKLNIDPKIEKIINEIKNTPIVKWVIFLNYEDPYDNRNKYRRYFNR